MLSAFELETHGQQIRLDLFGFGPALSQKIGVYLGSEQAAAALPPRRTSWVGNLEPTAGRDATQRHASKADGGM